MDRDDSPYRRFLRAMFGEPRVTDHGDGTFSYTWEEPDLLSLPARIDSDTLTASLADDATWAHMRSLYPSPNELEGVS